MARPETIGDTLQLLDEAFPEWREYQLGYEPQSVGTWHIENFDIPRNDVRRVLTVWNEGDHRDPGWGENFTRLVRIVKRKEKDERTVWMSDTKAEIREHWPIIGRVKRMESYKMTGDMSVVINGLGLGLVVNACLLHGIGHVDVVENNANVIKLHEGRFPADRVTIHYGDAFTIKWPRGKKWDYAWHDIWPEIDVRNLPEMHKLQRRYASRTNWQGSWCYDRAITARDGLKADAKVMQTLLGQIGNASSHVI